MAPEVVSPMMEDMPVASWNSTKASGTHGIVEADRPVIETIVAPPPVSPLVSLSIWYLAGSLCDPQN